MPWAFGSNTKYEVHGYEKKNHFTPHPISSVSYIILYKTLNTLDIFSNVNCDYVQRYINWIFENNSENLHTTKWIWHTIEWVENAMEPNNQKRRTTKIRKLKTFTWCRSYSRLSSFLLLFCLDEHCWPQITRLPFSLFYIRCEVNARLLF